MSRIVVRPLVVAPFAIIGLLSMALAQSPSGTLARKSNAPDDRIRATEKAAILLDNYYSGKLSEDMQITDDQWQKLEELMVPLAESTLADGAYLMRKHSPDKEVEQKNQGAYYKAAEGFDQTAHQVLTRVLTAKQLSRLRELVLQRRGTIVLCRQEIISELKLTPQQEASVKSILKTVQAKNNEIGNRPMSAEERTKEHVDIEVRMAKAYADMLDVLTADQKKQFEKMKGVAFEFSKPKQKQ